MADDKTRRGSPDNKRLNKSEPYEVAYARRKAAGGAARKAAGKGAARKAAGGGTARKAAGGGAARKSASTRKTAGTRARPAASPGAIRPTPRKSRGPGEEKTAANTAPKAMKSPDAVDLLVDDHLEVDACFKRYEKLVKAKAPAAERERLARTVCGLLKVHTTIEEEIFYPAARRAGVDSDLLDEADIEHASAKELIGQIEGGTPSDDHYDARVTVLGEYIAHHVKEEHSEMFSKCRRSKMDLVALRESMQARKEALQAEVAEDAQPGLIARVASKVFGE